MSHCSTEVEECLVSAFREQVRAVMEEGKGQQALGPWTRP
jgi:hypothetical protein